MGIKLKGKYLIPVAAMLLFFFQNTIFLYIMCATIFAISEFHTATIFVILMAEN
jgi:hypothetical protein